MNRVRTVQIAKEQDVEKQSSCTYLHRATLAVPNADNAPQGVHLKARPVVHRGLQRPICGRRLPHVRRHIDVVENEEGADHRNEAARLVVTDPSC